MRKPGKETKPYAEPLKLLLAEIDAIMNSGQFIAPESDLAPDEEIVGTMTEMEKTLFTLWHRKQQKIGETCLSCKQGLKENSATYCASKALLEQESTFLCECMRIQIRSRLKIFNSDYCFHLRSQFQITKHKKDEIPPSISITTTYLCICH